MSNRASIAKTFNYLLFIVLILLQSANATAVCSSRQIQRLSAKGVSVSEIAKSCHMDKSDVVDFLKDDDDSSVIEDEGANVEPDGQKSGGWRNGNNRGTSSGAPSGTVLMQCGCWGYDLGNPRQDLRCQSGWSMPQPCGMFCSAGGVAWGVVCR